MRRTLDRSNAAFSPGCEGQTSIRDRVRSAARLAGVLASFTCATGALAQAAPPDDIARQSVERRAAEAVIWGMPAVNADLMFQQAFNVAGAKENQIVYWSKLPSWKNQTLTPNPDTIYLMPLFNTKDVGPVVLEIPPAGDDGSITGNIDNVWQVALEDAGPAGADKGRGGKYLILPPDYALPVPEGYIPLRSTSYQGFALLRSILKSGSQEDIAKAVAYGRRVKLYPLSQAANPRATTFVDAADTVFDSTIPYDARFFRSLDRIVQSEPWLDRDRAMIDTLKTLGIEKGKPFTPSADMESALTQGARQAHDWIETKYESLYPPYAGAGNWFSPGLPDVVLGQADDYPTPDQYPVDGRGVTYSFGFIGIKHLGGGQFYLISIKDKDGKAFDGGDTYRLTVPANAPVSQYWSATVYDRETHTFIRGQTRFSRSSQDTGLKKNADGSVDIFFGPKAPDDKEGNWVPTKPGGRFEVMFRLYGPSKLFFDKVWQLPDLEKIAAAPASAIAVKPGATVTPDNFNRAESDMYFAASIQAAGGIGKLGHHREVMDIDKQTVIRANRDTLYSSGVFDLDAGPVTITMPPAGGRFMSMIVIDEDQYAPAVYYGAGSRTLTRKQVGTRYVMVGIRTFVDPEVPNDLETVHALQDAIKVRQKSAGTWQAPNWDQASQKRVRDALVALAATVPDTKQTFGARGKVDPVRHLIGTATGWGGNPEKDALYDTVTPANNDGKTVYRLHVGPVPVDGFWSISVYNGEGYFQKAANGGNSLNNVSAKKNADGSVDVQFGGCDGQVPNCLATFPGWNYWVRLYRPHAEVLSGKWAFPAAVPAD